MMLVEHNQNILLDKSLTFAVLDFRAHKASDELPPMTVFTLGDGVDNLYYGDFCTLSSPSQMDGTLNLCKSSPSVVNIGWP